MKDFNILRQLSLTESLEVQVTGPSIMGELQCSLLHEELTEYCRQMYPGGIPMPKCLDIIFYFAQLGISHMTELFEELNGSLHIMEASQFTARWPHAHEAHIYLLQQLTIFLTQGFNKPTKRKRSMPEASRQVVNAQFWTEGHYNHTKAMRHNRHSAWRSARLQRQPNCWSTGTSLPSQLLRSLQRAEQLQKNKATAQRWQRNKTNTWHPQKRLHPERPGSQNSDCSGAASAEQETTDHKRKTCKALRNDAWA